MPETALTATRPRSSAMNILKHGLHTESIVIPSESENDWNAHVEATIEHYAPENAVEHALATRIAELLWRLRRAARAERDSIVANEQFLDGMAEHDAMMRSPVVARKPIRALPLEPVLNAVMRYEAHLNRHLFQTLHELEAMQLRRNGAAAPLARVQIHHAAE